MNRSESLKEFAPAFLAAQMQMQGAKKDATNPHFNRAYSDFASVVDAVKGPLNDAGIAYLQLARTTDVGVEIETVLMHKSGEFYSETLLIPVQKRDAQAVGSAISYGKRYGLQSICGIASEDDDGNAASGPRSRQTSDDRRHRDVQKPEQRVERLSDGNVMDRDTGEVIPPPRCTGRQVQELRELLETAKGLGLATPQTAGKWHAKYGVKAFEELSSTDCMKLIQTLRGKLDAAPRNGNGQPAVVGGVPAAATTSAA